MVSSKQANTIRSSSVQRLRRSMGTSLVRSVDKNVDSDSGQPFSALAR
jgi:hypothetical protein